MPGCRGGAIHSARTAGGQGVLRSQPGPYAAGESSFIGETLKRLGAQNIVTADGGRFPSSTPSSLCANPDVILIGQRSADGLQQRPGWQGIRALREQRVCIFPATRPMH